MDFADASLYWLAVESGITEIMTVDVNDFSRYRLPDGRAFTLLWETYAPRKPDYRNRTVATEEEVFKA